MFIDNNVVVQSQNIASAWRRGLAIRLGKNLSFAHLTLIGDSAGERYQAFRLRRLTSVHGTRILEIGAGLGRTAYYARRLGLTNYTVVDLPMANVAQASFLGETLGADALVLSGEAPRAGCIRLLTSEWLLDAGETFDVVLNVDSMTEMDRTFADEYARFIQAHARCFLSINHESNPFRVDDLAALGTMFSQRFPYLMRDGYTEEVYLNPALLAPRRSLRGPERGCRRHLPDPSRHRYLPRPAAQPSHPREA